MNNTNIIDKKYLNDYEFIEFAHFNNKNTCQLFTNYVKKIGFAVKHNCCGNTGCGIANIDKNKIKELIQSFNRTCAISYDNNEKEECKICFNDVNKELFISKCSTSHHEFCKSCWDQIKNPCCPICRSAITN